MTAVDVLQMSTEADDLVRRAQAGEVLTITVSGRPAATLGPARPRTWRRWNDVAEIFYEPTSDTKDSQ